MNIIEEAGTAIATAAVDALLGAGLRISINNGGEENEINDSVDRETILKALRASDQDQLLARKPGMSGWVLLIYGNAQDLISDYTVNLEAILAPANKLADVWGEKLGGGAYCDDCDGETRIEEEEIAERKDLSPEDLALIEDALGRAESFMSGFEGDETQEGIDEDLEAIRHAQAALGDLPEAVNGQPS